MNPKSILIVTTKLDPHADAVIDELSAMGCSVFRLNSEDLLLDYIFTFQSSSPGSDGVLTDSLGRRAVLSNIQAAYYRKPRDVSPPAELLDEGVATFASQEGAELLKSLYAFPRLRWVNEPNAIRRAQPKFPQLAVAESLGMRTPRTIVTNDPERAHEFCVECSFDVVCKTLIATTVAGSDGALHTYTHRLNRSEIEAHIDAVRYAPTLIQEWIPKESEIRATVIGDEVFACEIDSQVVPDARVDWRVVDPQTIPHRKVVLPDSLSNALVGFIRRYQLQFGAIDLIKTPDGSYVFLENNPNGQWYWIEILTGMRMARSVAQLLTSEMPVK